MTAKTNSTFTTTFFRAKTFQKPKNLFIFAVAKQSSE